MLCNLHSDKGKVLHLQYTMHYEYIEDSWLYWFGKKGVRTNTYMYGGIFSAGNASWITSTLCRDEFLRTSYKCCSFQSNTELATLFCYWRRSAIPYLMVKEEVVNNDPRIVLFHDVISDDEIYFLKNTSSTKVRSEFKVACTSGLKCLYSHVNYFKEI